MNDNLIRNISHAIYSLASIDCEGCIYSLDSFQNHTCYTLPWLLSVCVYYKQALNQLGIVDCDGLREQVENYGPSYN